MQRRGYSSQKILFREQNENRIPCQHNHIHHYLDKMEPASSDDDSSVEEQASSRKLTPREVDSESDDSSDDDDDDESSADEHDMKAQHKAPQNFDELPSDDSCMEDSDEDENGDSEDSDDDDDDDDEDEDEEREEDIPLSERIHAKRNNGIVRPGRARKAERKIKAVAIAQKRISEMKRKREKKQKNSGSDDSDSDSDNNLDVETSQSKKRSKHAPAVACSSRKAFFQRGAPSLNSSGIGVEIGANRYKSRDPRMESLSGHFDQNVFDKRYDFLEKIQDEEIDQLKQKCKAWKTKGRKGKKLRKKMEMTGVDEGAADEDDEELKRLIQERASRKDARVRNAAKRAVKKKLRDEVAEGKRGAYHLKRSDMKKLELEARFEQLRKMGGDSAVNKALSKRRKRKMGKDSGLMPSR